MTQYTVDVHQYAGARPGRNTVTAPGNDQASSEAETPCPLCSDPMRPWLTVPGDWRRPDARETYSLFWCDRCAYGCVHPRPNVDALSSYYDIASYYTHSARKDASGGDQRAFLDRVRCHLAWRLDKGRSISGSLIQELLDGKPSRVCDLGCGAGGLLEEARTLGHDVVGIEPDQAARTIARERGLTVHDGTAEHLPSELELGSFDMVLMSHALEHCVDPVNALCNARLLLKPSGVLLCETPNSEARGLTRAGITWFWLDVPRHLNFFTERSIAGACSRAGFKVVETQVTGYYRQFTPGWIDAERRIWNTFKESGAANGALPVQNSAWQSWQLLFRTAFASRAQKYDSIRVVAHPEFHR